MTDHSRYVLEALQKGVLAAVAASSTPALPVKFVGRTFEPPQTGSWLELVHLPNDLSNEFWADGQTYRGVFRLVFMQVMNDKGAYNLMDLARSVSDYFTKGLGLVDPGSFVNVKIIDNPRNMGPMEEAPNIMVPVSIRYQCFKAA